uniref:Uncharacterized protein n=1 Tax=Ixodes ricinus TaxID=34613 RepID=A0A6B0V2H6_IXORI
MSLLLWPGIVLRDTHSDHPRPSAENEFESKHRAHIHGTLRRLHLWLPNRWLPVRLVQQAVPALPQYLCHLHWDCGDALLRSTVHTHGLFCHHRHHHGLSGHWRQRVVPGPVGSPQRPLYAGAPFLLRPRGAGGPAHCRALPVAKRTSGDSATRPAAAPGQLVAPSRQLRTHSVHRDSPRHRRQSAAPAHAHIGRDAGIL